MEETLEGGRGPPRAVVPLERERENTLFSNTLSFLSSCSVNDQVSQPYKTTGKITVLYILIFKFLDNVSALVGVIIKVILQNAWCNNKDALNI